MTELVRRETCPICGAASARTLVRRSYDDPLLGAFLKSYYSKATDIEQWLRGGTYQVDRCSECVLVFQRFLGSPALLEVLYDVWLNSTFHPETDPFFQSQIRAPARSRDGHELFVLSHFLNKPVTSLRVLDYGMGWGLWAQIAQRLGAHTFGHELSATRTSYAASKGISVVGSTELPRLEADFVNVDQVLEHTSAPLEVARELVSALRVGGILKISVPRASDIERRLRVLDWDAPKLSRNSLHPIHPLEHVNCFSPRSLAVLRKRLGLALASIPVTSSYAFFTRPEAIPRAPKFLAKAVLRPAYNRFSRNNQYAWFQRVS